jgi:hypothetical protein
MNRKHVVMLALAATFSAPARAEVTRRAMVERSVTATLWDETTTVHLVALETGTPSEQEVEVFVSVYGEGYSIWGTISLPSSAMIGDANGLTRLEADVASAREAIFTQCVDNPVDPMLGAICTPFTDGRISLRFQHVVNGWWDMEFHDNYKFDAGGYTEIWQGSSEWRTQSVDGSVFGWTVPSDMKGMVTDSRNQTVTVQPSP